MASGKTESKDKRTYTKRNPRERFLQEAAHRTGRALKALRALRACSNRNRYQYGESDCSEMFKAITAELAATREAFTNGKGEPEAAAFSFTSK